MNDDAAISKVAAVAIEETKGMSFFHSVTPVLVAQCRFLS